MKRPLLVLLGVGVAIVALLYVVGSREQGPGGGGGEAALRAVGAPASGACALPVDVPAEGASEHVSGTIVYDRVPPSSGRHAPMPATIFGRRLDAEDPPPVERIVHNLEHGWIVVWYDPAAADLALLDQALAAAEERKLVAVPFTRAPLPAPYVLTAWGHERRCTSVSGEAIADFVVDHAGRNGDAPEPDAA